MIIVGSVCGGSISFHRWPKPAGAYRARYGAGRTQTERRKQNTEKPDSPT